MISESGTVWVNGSGRHHDSRKCAGQDAVPAFEEFVAGAKTEPCGLCEPYDLVACEQCGERYKHERYLKRHYYQTHLSESEQKDAPDGDDTWKELDAKARGGTS